MAMLLGANATPLSDRLWKELTPTKSNVVLSAPSISTCLGLLVPATKGATQTAVLKTLGGSAPSPELRASLVKSGEVTLSNAFFVAYPFSATYAQTLKDQYKGEVQKLLPGSAGAHQVNGWVDTHTKHRIPKLVDKFEDDETAVWVNTVTFDGKWQIPFNKDFTQDASFSTPKKTIKVPTMHLSDQMVYGEDSKSRWVSLFYKGREFQMTIALPKIGQSPTSLLNEASKLGTDNYRRTKVILSLPKFVVRSEPNVEKPLAKLGLAPLFSHADFTPAVPSGKLNAISRIIHKTFVKVDEEGTEAAAVTGVVVKTTAIRNDQPPIEFNVNQPFAFVIRHVSTGEVLFQGAIYEPTQS